MPPRKKKAETQQPSTSAAEPVSNADKTPAKGFQRQQMPVEEPVQSALPETLRTSSNPNEIASGRGLTYEWEFFVQNVQTRLAAVESGGGGGGGGSGSATYVHTQTLASASWAVTHSLATKPSVVVVNASGQELLAEVHYPDNNTTVIVFGSPYAGTAYLHG